MGALSELARLLRRGLPASGAAALAAGSDDADAGFVTRGGKEILEAWHGSPHKFDRFSMDSIGTGEGAQAYGHGLYFADNKGIATGYRDSLTPRDYDYEEKLYSRYKQLEEAGDAEGMEVYELAMQYESPADMLERFAMDEQSPERMAKLQKYIDEVDAIPVDRGHLYRTEIDVTPDQLLDWDRPLRDQPKALRAFQEIYSDEAMRLDPEILGELYSNPADVDMAALGLFDKSKGAQAYNTIKDMNYVRGAPAMSEKLREKGIRGIKYLDGDSRAAGDGTSNYVIFDDNLINIAERGNATPEMMMALALGSGGATAAASEGLGTRLMNHIGDNVTEVLDLLEVPQRGLQGLIRAGYGLTQGERLEASLMAGADVVENGVEAAAKAAGDKVLEETGSPELAAMAYMATILGSPI